jgi:arylsulfatase A-like enzyme
MIHKNKKWLLVLIITGILISAAVISFTFLRSSRIDAVFLIVVDTLRADRLSCYGYKEHKTPNIDRLASLGVKSENAQAVSSWTRPSMGAILTSSYPIQLGLVEKPEPTTRRFKCDEKRDQIYSGIPAYKRTWAEILASHSFHTCGFINQPSLNCLNGFERGFMEYYYPFGPDAEVRKLEKEKLYKKQVWGTTRDGVKNDRALVKAFEKWLSKNSQKKLFVWLHLLAPHRPYNPPGEFRRPPGKEFHKNRSNLYDGEVLASDQMIGTILDAIIKHVDLERSIIVFVSDHGENLWDHGCMTRGHGQSLHREIIHVPLIIVSPKFPKNVSVKKSVRTIDILPTVLEELDLQSEAPGFEGISLLPFVQKKQTGLTVYSEGMLYGNTQRSLIDKGLKIIFDEQRKKYSLYDIKNDPNEKLDISKKRVKKTKRMIKKLSKYYIKLYKEYQHHVKKESFKVDETRRQLNRKALRTLGYIDN